MLLVIQSGLKIMRRCCIQFETCDYFALGIYDFHRIFVTWKPYLFFDSVTSLGPLSLFTRNIFTLVLSEIDSYSNIKENSCHYTRKEDKSPENSLFQRLN
ncbi:hypothetical protein TNIN_384911 [Trichonephila inaurata madagascariensis]|uniref:Uncharacterized protein n=1 Tax=Trichonephila inaurata madagascariensis TaxID=2747483 RepID=A0A8X6Y9H3_9ARAC|nr:hypothetical protein TNIN_384911 [Trichonephila inaurata madagascariensis]